MEVNIKGVTSKLQIQTDKGIVEGVKEDGCIVFKGIPYAKPPVGILRWRAPEEAEPWEGVLKADHFSTICPQSMPGEGMEGYHKEFYSDEEYSRKMDEDCLYLNIWIPEKKSNEPLPVAFWIHGGGFSGGYSSEIEFDGEAYCRKNVILVTIGYRVNVFGFLAHPWLTEENPQGISGNYGILDQIAALRWVKSNISAFGGDPENITVFGQSAGSMSTQVLVSSPLTQGMIAKAILQSGISCEKEILLTPSLSEEEEYGKQLVAHTKAKSLDELRVLSAEELVEAKKKFDAEKFLSGEGLVMVPNVDGHVLTQTVKESWKSGTMREIPYMAGCVNADLGASKEDEERETGGPLLEECINWSHQCEKAFGKPAYVYHFAHSLPGDDEVALKGAFHSAEIWYMMGTLGKCWRPMKEEDEALSEEMVTLWTTFMKTGDLESVGWKPCSEKDSYVKKFK